MPAGRSLRLRRRARGRSGLPAGPRHGLMHCARSLRRRPWARLTSAQPLVSDRSFRKITDSLSPVRCGRSARARIDRRIVSLGSASGSCRGAGDDVADRAGVGITDLVHRPAAPARSSNQRVRQAGHRRGPARLRAAPCWSQLIAEAARRRSGRAAGAGGCVRRSPLRRRRPRGSGSSTASGPGCGRQRAVRHRRSSRSSRRPWR